MRRGIAADAPLSDAGEERLSEEDRRALKMIEEALDCARRLARVEGLFCGSSSGTNVVAVLRLAAKRGPGKTVVTLAPIPASATSPPRCSRDSLFPTVQRIGGPGA